MSQVKRCLNYYQSPEFDPPQQPVPRDSVQILSDRIYAVSGDEDKCNDVIFTAFPDPAKVNIIYFHGDVQNYSELMTVDRDADRLRDDFNLENVGRMLLKRFNEVVYPCHIWIIRACKYISNKFIVYNNFLPMTNEGTPSFGRSCIPSPTKNITALPHLTRLFQNAVDCENERLKDRFGAICSTSIPSILVGFSKGCVVLTKILHEIHLELLDNRCEYPFVTRLRDMYWLDSSHNGDEELWPHDPIIFDRINRCRQLRHICFHAYATPFQIGRPIKLRSCQEFGQLTEILLRLGVQHSSGYLLRGDEINLQTHFDVLKAFPIKRK